MMPDTRLMQFRLVPAAIATLSAAGLDGRPLLSASGIPEQFLSGGPCYLTVHRVRAFLDGCADLAGDPLFGWNLASQVPLGTYGLTEFAMRTAGDLAAGLDAVCRFGSLVNGLTTFTVSSDADTVSFGFQVASSRDSMGTQLNEYTMHYLLRVVRSFGDTRPLRVGFSHARPTATASALAKACGAPVWFEAPRCVMELSRGALTRSSPLSDAGLSALLETQLVGAFSTRGERDVVGAVREVVSSRLGRSSLAIGPVSRQVAMSVRSVQRALARAGTTYQEVVDLVRLERSRELLLTPLQLQEVARRLGYAEATAFTHAFKRWSGVSPLAWRSTVQARLSRP